MQLQLPPNSLQTPVQSSSSLAGCGEMAKYQGWRGVQGNFRGKVEVQLQLGWLQRNGQVPGMEGSTEGNFRGKVEERVQQKGNSRDDVELCLENYR